MNVSLYQAAAALNANSRWEDVVSENLASGSVSGFRKQALSTAAIQAGLMPTTSGQFAPEYYTMPQVTVGASFHPGEMEFTGEMQNAAIEGQGFFQVQLADGTPAVTRDGEFQLNAKGVLVTKEGYAVVGDNGPIQMDAHNHDPITISAAGEVRQGSALRGKLSLTDFENRSLLTSTNGVYFLADNPALKTKETTATLRDGFVESSNASSLTEMANMMTAMRTFEANQHVVQIQDDRLGKVISELGNPT